VQPAGYGTYRRIQAETASPGELILMLYDGLLRDLARADLALEQGDLEAAHAPLLRAQEIVLELSASLDHEAGGELATQIAALYDYIYRRLVTANLHKDIEVVREAAKLLRPLHAAWEQAVPAAAASLAAAGPTGKGTLRG